MFTPSLSRLVAAASGLTLVLTVGTGIASADPELWSVVNTTCNYSQVVAAMNAQSPATAAQFNATPAAQSWLNGFLAAPPAQRQQMVEEAQNSPEAAPFVAVMAPLASTCQNY